MITAIANNVIGSVQSRLIPHLRSQSRMRAWMTSASLPMNSRMACPDYYTQEHFVRKDSGIDKVEDLKGKVIGTNAGGSAVDVAMRAMSRQAWPRRKARLHNGREPSSRYACRAAGEKG